MRLSFRWISPSLGKPAASVDPCEGALNDPTPGQDFETFGGIGPFDDFDGPFAVALERIAQFVARITAIGKDMPQPREAVTQSFQHDRRTVPVLDTRRMDDDEKHVMIAAIEAENIPSIRLHEKLGFRGVGRFTEVGQKFGRWLDLYCMEKVL